MKHPMAFLALWAALPFCWASAETPPENKSAVAQPIEITHGYGSAKWGMSVEDFQRAYPQAKLVNEVEEDLWKLQKGAQNYTWDDGSKTLTFFFLRGTLVQVRLTMEERFPDGYSQNTYAWVQNVSAKIAKQFSYAKDSGVAVSPVIQQAMHPLLLPPGGVGVPSDPVAVRRRPLVPPSIPNSPPPKPGINLSPAPAMGPQSPSPMFIVMVTMEQHKLLESIEAEFKELTDTARNRATNDVISKLGPPM